MEAIYKVNYELGNYDYEEYFIAKGLMAQGFIQNAVEFIFINEEGHSHSYTSRINFEDVIREIKKGGKWYIECYYSDDDVFAIDVERITIRNK